MKLAKLYRSAAAIKERVRPFLGRPRACLACRTIGRKHMRRPRLPPWDWRRYTMWECKKCRATLDRRGRPSYAFLCARCGDMKCRPTEQVMVTVEWTRRLWVQWECSRCGDTFNELITA